MRILPTAFALVLAACGGGGGGSNDTNPLDLDGDGLLRFPWGVDLDDDGDGALTYLAGGTDYDDTSASVQANGGAGDFSGDNVLYAVGDSPTAAALGDLNNDGSLDVAVTNQDDDTLSIFLGAGDGTLTGPTSVALPNGGGDVDVGDFNADGNLDLFARGAVLLGNGDGTFGTPSPLPEVISPATVRDLNGDGHLDIVGTNFDVGLTVALGNGDGTFAMPTTTVFGGTSETAVADVNGDGFLDAVGALGGANAFELFLGGPGATFTAAAMVPVPGYAGSIATADMNDDGHADVVVSNVIGSEVYVLLGNGALAFGAPITSDLLASVDTLVLERFSGARVDAIAGTTQGTLLASGGGDGTLTPIGFAPPSDQVIHATTGDLNNDGILDVVSVYIGRNEIGVLLGQ